MPKIEQKQVVINEIKDRLEKAESVVLVDGIGLTVGQDTELRKKLREAGVDYKVYKNTMINFAVQDTEFEGLKDHLTGPTAMAFSYEDATAAARIIAGEAKEFKNLEFKAGVVEGLVYDSVGIEKIAQIPAREVLLSRLLGSFKAPMGSFARVVKAIAEKDGEAVASEEGTVETPEAVEETVEAVASEEGTVEETPEAVGTVASEEETTEEVEEKEE